MPLATGLLVLTGCGNGLGSGTSDKKADGPIVLGMTAPFSGSNAAAGPAMADGAKLAISEINAKGGVLGRKLKLETQDDACDPKTGVAAANKLVTDQVAVSIGGYCSGVTLPMLPIFAKAKVPMIIPAANSNDLVKAGQKNVFLINGTSSQQGAAALKWIQKQSAIKIAIVNDASAYSKDIADVTQKLVDDTGSAKTVINESITPGESDYSANINSVLNKKPDLVYFTGYYQEGGLIVRQLRQAGFKGQIMVGDGNVAPEFIKIAGEKYANGVVATMTLTPDTIPGGSTWVASFKKKFKSEPGPYSNQSYDAVRLAAEAIKTAKSTDGDKVITALEGIDGFKLFSGPLKFTPDHTLTGGGFQILAAVNGKFELKDTLTN